MSKKLLERLSSRFGSAVLETHSQFGDDTAVVDPSRWKEIAFYLRDDNASQMDHFIDLTAVDFFGRQIPRYEVVLHVRSNEKLHRLRLKVRVHAEGDDLPEVDSLVEVWRGANWFEREVFDLFGIRFRGHPDMRRILMYEEFVGHPLRKDYPVNKTQPLIPYREGVENQKLPPFGLQEGLPFGRQSHDHAHREPNLLNTNALGFEKDG
jgi:NADH-quinone oxidoreductase subunit C